MIETPEEFVQEIYKASADSGTMDAEIAKLIASRDAAIRKESKWISVKERLPEDDDPIVVINNIKSWKGHSWLVRGIRLDPNKPDIKDGEYCAWDGFNKIWGVTHWMPLPEPPVVKEGEE